MHAVAAKFNAAAALAKKARCKEKLNELCWRLLKFLHGLGHVAEAIVH
jgi:hypothetical protein